MDFDSVIVGAGPTGAVAARDISAAGNKVLVLEDHAQVGEPLHCSGLVTPRTTELVGLPPSLIHNTVMGAYLNHSSGKSVRLGGKRVYAQVIDRVGFDRFLVDQAVGEGVEISLRSRLMAIERRGDGLRLSVRTPSGEKQLSTRLLVGADGAQSTVARWLGSDQASDALVGLSVEARLATRSPDMVEVFIGRGIAPGFFGWLIPQGNGCVRIGVATSGGEKPVTYLQKLQHHFPEILDGAEFGSYFGGIIPMSRIEKPYAANVLLVGDAAGQVKPTSGGGIYAGLIGARHAARVAVSALASGDLGEQALAPYGEAWDREFSREFSVMKYLRKIFLNLSDSQMKRLLDLIERPVLLRLANRYGDIDFPSHFVGELLRKPFPTFLQGLGSESA